MKILLPFYITSFTFLALGIGQKTEYQWMPNTKKSINRFLSKDANALASAFIFGNKRKVRKKIKESFKVLNLLHLMTPSGLHLGALYLLITRLFSKLLSKRIIITSLSLLSLGIQFLDGYHSLKRVALFYILNKALKLNTKVSFLLTFILNFIFGSYFESPLSFAFSFLFWGVLILSSNKVTSKTLHLIFAQLIVAFFFEDKVYLLGSLIGLGLSAVFSILFGPTILISLTPLKGVAEFIINSFLFLVQILSELAMNGPQLFIGFFWLIVISLFICTRKWGWLLLSLSVNSQPLYNFPVKSFKIASTFKDNKLIDYGAPKKSKWKGRGFNSWYEPSIKCRTTLYSYYYKRKCRTYR